MEITEPICLITRRLLRFNSLLHVYACSLSRRDVNEVIYDAEGAREGQYGYTWRSIWVWYYKQHQPG